MKKALLCGILDIHENLHTFSSSLFHCRVSRIRKLARSATDPELQLPARQISFSNQIDSFALWWRVLRRCYVAQSATEHFVVRLDQGNEGTPGVWWQVGGEKTQLNVGGSVGGTQFDCFFIAIILVPSPAPGNGDLTRHGVLLDLYRVFLQS